LQAPGLIGAATVALTAVAAAGCVGASGVPPPTATPTPDATTLAAVATQAAGRTATPTGETCLSVDVVGNRLDISGEDFSLVDGGMKRTIDFAEQNDVGSATMTFLHEVHAFTHVIDVPLREKDDQLGLRLWNAVYELEAGMAQGIDGASMADGARAIRELLREGGRALGCGG
jgi:hypothetical protein